MIKKLKYFFLNPKYNKTKTTKIQKRHLFFFKLINVVVIVCSVGLSTACDTLLPQVIIIQVSKYII